MSQRYAFDFDDVSCVISFSFMMGGGSVGMWWLINVYSLYEG